MSCTVCATDKREILELVQRLAVLRRRVEECEGVTTLVDAPLAERVRDELHRNGVKHAALLLRSERDDLTAGQCISFAKALAASEPSASREGVTR